MKKYTKEQLIFFLKKFAKKINRTPTCRGINKNKKCPSSSTYSNRFGSWNRALAKARLELNNVKKYNKKELIDNLIQLRKELGRVPKSIDLKNKKWCASYSTYKKYFGSWKNALIKAKIKEKKVMYTDLKNYITKRKKK